MGQSSADRSDDLPTGVGSADPDATWRPVRAVALADGRPRPGHDEPGGPTRHEAVSPWSREAIESPLPSIEAIRHRWRTELGLDAVERTIAEPAGAVARPAGGSTVTGDVVLTGLVVALLVAVGLAAAWALRPTPSAPEPTLDRLPVSADVRWTATSSVPLDRDAVAVEGDVLATIGDGELVVRDLTSGDVRWSSTIAGIGDDHRLAVYDDVVVAVGSRGTDLSITAYDVATGATLWERLEPDASYWTHESGLIELTRPDGEMHARTLDPATGDVVGVEIRMHEWPAPDGYLVGSTDRTNDIALLDIATGRLVRPAVPAFGVSGIAPVGDAIVGFTDQDEIVLYDDAGVPVDQRRFVSEAFGDFAGRAELVGGAPGTTIGVVASGTSLGFEVADGRIEVVWEVRGRVGPAVDTAVGPLAIGRLVDRDTGVVGSAVVDVRDATIVAEPELDGELESDPLILHDGYVAPPAIGDPDRVVAAFDFDGTERWSFALGGDAWFTVDGGVLVEVDKGVLTVHG